MAKTGVQDDKQEINPQYQELAKSAKLNVPEDDDEVLLVRARWRMSPDFLSVILRWFLQGIGIPLYWNS